MNVLIIWGCYNLNRYFISSLNLRHIVILNIQEKKFVIIILFYSIKIDFNREYNMHMIYNYSHDIWNGRMWLWNHEEKSFSYFFSISSIIMFLKKKMILTIICDTFLFNLIFQNYSKERNEENLNPAKNSL